MDSWPGGTTARRRCHRPSRQYARRGGWSPRADDLARIIGLRRYRSNVRRRPPQIPTRMLGGTPMQRSRSGLQPVRILLAVLFLGTVVYLLRGDEFDLSPLGALAIAAVYLGIGVLLELIIRRRRL